MSDVLEHDLDADTGPTKVSAPCNAFRAALRPAFSDGVGQPKLKPRY